jgi:hypothetical protein
MASTLTCPVQAPGHNGEILFAKYACKPPAVLSEVAADDVHEEPTGVTVTVYVPDGWLDIVAVVAFPGLQR